MVYQNQKSQDRVLPLSRRALALAALALSAGVSPALAAEALVDSSPESILSLSSDMQASRVELQDMKQFVSCFVARMDLPQQVYLDCALGIYSTVQACREEIMNVGCVSSAVETAQKCALPVQDTIEGVKECLAEQKQ